MNIRFSSIKKRSFFIVLIMLIVGCGSTGCEKANKQTLPNRQMVKKYDQAVSLEGLVTRANKPIKTGAVKAMDRAGRLVAGTVLQDSNHYRIDIPANTDLPIVLTFYPSPESAGTDKLVAVVVEPSITKYDLNPLTTAIAKKAEALGGYTRANLVMAAESMVAAPDANKTSTGFRGDPTTQYGGWH